MNRKQINQLQRRVLKPDGNKYNSLIESTNCRVFENGHGPASEILTAMVRYATKYAYQVKEVAQKLIKKDLQSTCNSFYQFERDYIQYDVDGREQRLRTPACLWSDRLKGGDCKSFAIMSAALCASVGIKSILRQIKVDGTQNENRINHVYCIVPVDQVTGSLNSGHYVIDGSSKINIEAPNYWKNDMEVDLPYSGMNGVIAQQVNSCGCGGSSCSNSTCTSNTNGMNAAIAANYTNDLFVLKSVLTQLINKGASYKTAQKALDYVVSIVDQGKQPVVEMEGNSLFVNGKVFNLSTSGSYGMNFDFSSLGASVVSGGSNTISPTSSTGGFSLGNFDLGGITGAIGGGSSDNLGSSLGSTVGTIGGTLAGGPIGAGIGSTIGGIVGGLFGGGTAGSAEMGTEDAKLDGEHFLSTSGISSAVTEQTFNTFIYFTENYYQARLAKSKWNQASATKEGNRLAAEGMKELQNAVIQQVSQQFTVTRNGSRPMAADREITTVGGWHGSTLPTTAFGSWTVPVYSLTPLAVNQNNGNQNGNDQGGGNAAPRENSLGSNIAIGIGILGAIALGAKYMKPDETTGK